MYCISKSKLQFELESSNANIWTWFWQYTSFQVNIIMPLKETHWKIPPPPPKRRVKSKINRKVIKKKKVWWQKTDCCECPLLMYKNYLLSLCQQFIAVTCKAPVPQYSKTRKRLKIWSFLNQTPSPDLFFLQHTTLFHFLCVLLIELFTTQLAAWNWFKT